MFSFFYSLGLWYSVVYVCVVLLSLVVWVHFLSLLLFGFVLHMVFIYTRFNIVAAAVIISNHPYETDWCSAWNGLQIVDRLVRTGGVRAAWPFVGFRGRRVHFGFAFARWQQEFDVISVGVIRLRRLQLVDGDFVLVLARYVPAHRVVARECSRAERARHPDALMTLSNVRAQIGFVAVQSFAEWTLQFFACVRLCVWVTMFFPAPEKMKMR